MDKLSPGESETRVFLDPEGTKKYPDKKKKRKNRRTPFPVPNKGRQDPWPPYTFFEQGANDAWMCLSDLCTFAICHVMLENNVYELQSLVSKF